MEEEKEVKKDGSVMVFNYDGYVKPEVVEEAGKDWVLNGEDNFFWDYILARYQGSPTNSAIIDAYVDRIIGKGISIVNAETNTSHLLEILSIMAPEEVYKVVFDYYLFGSACVAVRFGKGSKRKVAKADHLVRKKVAPAKMKKGVVKRYYVCEDFSNTNEYTPKSFPAFGEGQGVQKTEILEIKPYSPLKEYYADPTYLSGLPYAMLEEEISNYAVNHIKHGFSAGGVLNFNNGEPEEEVKEKITREVKRRTTGGSNAGQLILSFNNNSDNAPTFTAFDRNSDHEDWQSWTEIARQQIIVAHRVTNPMLFGIKENVGLGNNANEMRESTLLLHETVIRPKQQVILGHLFRIFLINKISSPLIFIPLEDEQEKKQAPEKKVEPIQPTEQQLQALLDRQLSEDAEALISLGEDEDEENWLCIISEEVDYQLEESRDMMLNALMVSSGVARPNASSSQDSEQFKVRYKYAPSVVGANSRAFCVNMVRAGKIYRKEDIVSMENKVVNAGWGPGGADKYSIWKYKGGGGCHHKWLRRTYVKKDGNVDVNSPLAEIISTAEARRRGDRTVNEPEVSMKPKDMVNQGFLN